MEIGELLKVIEKGTLVWIGTEVDKQFFWGKVEEVVFNDCDFFEDLKVDEISAGTDGTIYIEVSQ